MESSHRLSGWEELKGPLGHGEAGTFLKGGLKKLLKGWRDRHTAFRSVGKSGKPFIEKESGKHFAFFKGMSESLLEGREKAENIFYEKSLFI